MKKYVIGLFLVFTCLNSLHAQKDLSEYTFVVIPDKYEFQKKNDQYQLNSLTKFLFNKYGFNAYYNNELPNVSRCEGLWADAILDPGLIHTKLYITLKDCEGNEVYRTSEARSKLKDYKKLYHTCIRQAFESIQGLQIVQKEPSIFEEITNSVVVDKDVEQQKVTLKNVPAATLEDADILYSNQDGTFSLRATEQGHNLYKIEGDNLVHKGSLQTNSEGELMFLDGSGNQFSAYFDEEKNLVITTSFQDIIFKKEG